MKPLTKAEEQIMQTIWKLETAFLKDIVEAQPEPRPHSNTVATYQCCLTLGRVDIMLDFLTM